jgi:DNA-binding response OmpR family regulator
MAVEHWLALTSDKGERALNAGADDYALRPIRADRLLGRLLAARWRTRRARGLTA